MGRGGGLREVAAAAGVSVGTASHVLNHPDRVSPDVRSRVEDAMRRLEYRRHGAAARLATGSSGLFAAILPDVQNPFWTSVLAGAEQRLADLGSSLVMATAGYDAAAFDKVVHRLEQYGIQGVVVATAPTTRHLDICRDMSMDVVVAGADGRSRGIASVCVDDRAGSRLAADHLLGLGHERIAIVNGPRRRVWCARRHRGVLDAITGRGLDPTVVLREVVVDRMDVAHGRAAAPEVEALIRDADVTALVCANDLLAIGLTGELSQVGIRVPVDVSITGFDDIPAARWTAPGLTTVRQNPAAIGSTAVELLLDRSRTGHVVVRPELIVRASVVARRTR